MMNNEIKEILNYYRNIVNDKKETYTVISKDTIYLEQLLDYITNLQEENEELKKNQRYHKKGVFSLEYDKETLRDMVDELQERIEKAVEYIEKFIPVDNNIILMSEKQRDNVLNILNGRSDE